MNQLDVYYRALLNYKNEIESDNECVRFNNAFITADADSDKLVVTRAFCIIDEEWVEEIEKGLTFIEKAIKEDRQFILSQGEVVPIEKVKSVSKESVQHLAKHSDLITEYEEGEDIVPDKLYTVERLNDYTVYENRFLYMLLCYLRDFVSLRYTSITEATNKYDAVLTMNKEFMIGKEKITYSVNLHDVRLDDEYLKAANQSKDVIDRIMLILKAILSFLATPLMEYQAKVPMIKPPITKTNVLRMNNNFKGAVALYDYIISYDKKGYEIENKVTTISPFSDDFGNEIALVGGMMTFISYEQALGLRPELKASYEKEENRRKDEQIRKMKSQLDALNKKLQKSEITPQEYIVKLEEYVKTLDKNFEKMDALRKEIERLKENELRTAAEIKIVYAEVAKLKNDLANKDYENAQAISAMQQEHSQKMAEIIQTMESQKRDEVAKMFTQINALQDDIKCLMEKNKQDRDEAQLELNKRQEEYDKLKKEYDDLEEKRRLAEARLMSYRFKNKDMTADDDFTDKDGFDELENELEVFIKFYKQEWGKTKKKIRKDLLNIKNLRSEGNNQ